MSSVKKIVSHTAIYGVGRLIRGLASFVMLPIYMAYLVPADYGIVELMAVVLELTTLLVGSRVAVGIFKYYSDAEDDESRGKVIATALLLLGTANLVGVGVIYLVGEQIATWLNAPEGFDVALKVFAFTIVLGAINEVFYAYIRVRDLPIAYVSVNFLKLLTQIGLNILFIVYMELGYWGIVWGSLLSTLMMTVIFTIWLMPSIGWKVSKYYVVQLINFSYPIMVSSLCMYYITFGDRYFLKYFKDIETVGIYALSYKFGFALVALVWSPFMTFWDAKRFDYAKESGSGLFFGQLFFYANWFLFVGATGLVVLAPDFVHIIAREEFWPAIAAIPWLVAAYIVLCWTEYMRFGILNAGKTKYIAYAAMGTVVLITGLYLYWIPREGGVGAAKATLLAFFLRFIFIFRVSQSFFTIEVPWVRLGAMLALFSLLAFSISQLALPGWGGMLIKSAIIVVASILVMATPLVAYDHRQLALQKIKGLVKKRFSS